MPKYLVKASYSPEGLQGVLKDGGTGRRAAVQTAVEAAGGRLEAMYFAFGEDDVYAIFELPDNATAAGVALNVCATGRVRASTVVLLTPEEIDEAVGKQMEYSPPGG